MANTKMVSWKRPAGHGGRKEGTAHSGEQARGVGSPFWMKGPKVEIDYVKLRELCARNLSAEPQTNGLNRERHDQFMAEYSGIFKRKRCRSLGSSKPTLHSCYSTESGRLTGDISSHMIAIHGREKKEQDEIDLAARLKAMTYIVRKLPIQRSRTDVKRLCQHLLHFSDVFPNSQVPLPTLLPGLASRVYVEELPQRGYSLPDHNGVYIILQGTVERLSQDHDTKELTSVILTPGVTFGTLEGGGDDRIIKSTYPMYYSNEACTLMRITQVDYHKVVQKCRSASSSMKEGLLRFCPLMAGVSPSTLSKLAQSISWETISRSNTVVASEGRTISRVGIIQEGKCIGYAQVPEALKPAQVIVGELGPGDCIGEVFLRGTDTQPYTIVTTTPLTRIGWIEAVTIKVSEVEKHILPTTEFILPHLSRATLQNMYADKLLDKQWGRIRRDIVQEVLTERGVRRGTSKWVHSAHNRHQSQ